MFKFFFSRKIFSIAGSKISIHYFCNHTKNLYNKFEFLKKLVLELSEIQQIFFELDTSPIRVLRVSYKCRCPIRVSDTDTPFKRSVRA